MCSLRGAAAARTRPLITTVRPLAAFYPAEIRHQKNQLKRHPPVLQALERSGIQVDSSVANSPKVRPHNSKVAEFRQIFTDKDRKSGNGRENRLTVYALPFSKFTLFTKFS
jgi:hypothetical protein